MFTLRTPLLLMAMLFLFSMGCQEPCPPCDYEVPNGYRLVKIPSPQTTTTISQKQAEDWTRAWRVKMSTNGGFLSNDPIKAFTIPHQDIAGVITADSARAYLAIFDTLGTSTYHLVMVGVDSNGQDDLSSIYDLTLPCPDACDVRSPLDH